MVPTTSTTTPSIYSSVKVAPKRSPVKNEAIGETPFCLNTEECPGERHYLKDCTKTESAKKKELYDYLRKKRKEKPTAAKVSGAIPESIVPGPDRYNGTLADVFPVVVNGDYGADHSALSETHLKLCANNGVFVNILPLQKPIEMRLAAEAAGSIVNKSFNHIFASRKARITTTIETSNDPLRLRNVECLVFKEEMTEVLLSRPLLQSIGFDLDKHLRDKKMFFMTLTTLTFVLIPITILPLYRCPKNLIRPILKLFFLGRLSKLMTLYPWKTIYFTKMMARLCRNPR